MPTLINPKDFDTTTRPQDDFYQYISGGWFKKNSIPEDQARWGAFHILREQSQKQLKKIILDIEKKSERSRNDEEKKILALYKGVVNMRKRNRVGIAPLLPIFDMIDTIETKEELSTLFAEIHILGVGAPWGSYIEEDSKKSDRMVFHLTQGGIGVPNRNYHVKKDKESKRIRAAYVAYMKKVLKHAKLYKQKEIETIARNILKIETKLALASLPPEEMRDPVKLYNKFTQAGLQKKYPCINWKEYLDGLGVPKQARNHIIVDTPKFFVEVCKVIETTSVTQLKNYLKWHFLDDYSGSLGQEYVDANFAYGGVAIQGLKKQPDLWKRGVGAVNGAMGDALGKLYVKKHFPPKAKQEITKLVRNLIIAYRKRINDLDWMSAATKKKALKKLKTTQLLLGYPTKWESYTHLEIGDVHAENVLAVARFDHQDEMKRLTKPTDRNYWHMTPPTVNAYYNPNLNQIAFPAGILQPPFFYFGDDEAVNYGAIGMVIGHELTHGFDDSGSHYDEFGHLKNWWTKDDKRKFTKRTKILVDQFNGFTVGDGVSVNGKLTLGENIADLGGLVIAYKAFQIAQKGKQQRKKYGLTPTQRFFAGYAITERELTRPEFLKLIALTDPHSPSKFRVNGPLSHMEEFYEAFDVKEGDKLYREEKARAKIW